MTRQEYINRFKGAVLDACRGTGLFPSVMMAQAILESSNKNGEAGESTLARIFNNHFGIKAGLEWKGKKAYIKTTEVINGKSQIVEAAFRYYSLAEDSFKDRNRILRNNARYQKAGVFTAHTPEEQCDALQRGGYATAPNYAQVLKNLIKSLRLDKLDGEAAKNGFAAAA